MPLNMEIAAANEKRQNAPHIGGPRLFHRDFPHDGLFTPRLWKTLPGPEEV
jgi:hypothetical protein